MISRTVFAGIFLFLAVFTLSSEPYPTILKAELSDPLYRQLQEDIASYYVSAAKSPHHLPAVSFFSFTPSTFDTLFSVAARMNTGIQTLASINRIATPKEYSPERPMLVPSVPGLFIPRQPKTDIEYMVQATHLEELGSAIPVVVFSPERTEFLFLPGEEYSTIETAFFLGILFRFPLPSGTISSWFGDRKDPFTGNIRFHNGIDIAAPIGTSVFAAREGVVSEAGENAVLGIHCVIDHPAGYRTVYGHLSRCDVELHQNVRSGTIIGAVGSTGHSTGPHLHFEVRSGGKARDPASFVPLSAYHE